MQSGLYKGRKSYRYVKTAYTSSLKITECALKKGIDFLTFSVLGDLPSQSLQALLLHEQENQSNTVGLSGRGGGGRRIK